jgi:phenylacetate-CoA ligase
VSDVAAVLSYARSFDGRVADVLPAAARRVPALRRRVADAGVAPHELIDTASLDRVPILTKDGLLDLQRAEPPFGGVLDPDARISRIFQSPGPLYEAELEGNDHWRWGSALAAAGFTADDVVLNAFGYHLSPAGAMFEEACRALGATVVPGGVGNLDLQVRACADLGVTAYVGLPSYLKALLERAEAAGHDPRAWPLARAFVSAEPLPPSLRTWLAGRVAVVRQGYGTAETGNLGFESSAVDGLHVPDDALVQVCDLSTGAARYDGGDGQVVVTILDARAPVVRFGTGDLSAWATDEAGDASIATPRIRGWLGRVGDAVKVRGMFLHPRQVQQVMTGLDDVDAYRFVVDRVDHRDVLRCELVPAGAADVGALRSAVRERVRSGLRFDVEVTAVGELPDDARITDVRTWD